jgi:hypothetical protein
MFIQSFVSRPHAFANMHCLYPYSDPLTRPDLVATLAMAGGGDFSEIRGENKVGFCEILPCAMVDPLPSDLAPQLSYTKDIGLFVMRVTYNRASPTAVPVYYLPWRKDHMMRIKLKPSPNHPKQELGATLDPDLFVTAALQGCTVMVSGDPAQRLVYHLNAASTKGPGNETFGGDDADFDIAAQAKTGHMLAEFGRAQASHPKEGPKLGGIRQPAANPVTRGVHVTDYMIGSKPAPNAFLKDHYKRRFGANVIVAQYGTVYGIRTGGSWAFYRQTRTRVGYRPPGANYYVDEWVDPVAVRFWP